MGRRISGGASWARTDPSTYSMRECTIDWGCRITSTCFASMSNSHRASITSSPLFISVAESIVIFFPMLQTGWFKASRGGGGPRPSLRALPQRSPRGGQDNPLQRPPPAPLETLEDRGVLAVHRQELHPSGRGLSRQQGPGHYEGLLGGDRHVLAGPDRRH